MLTTLLLLSTLTAPPTDFDAAAAAVVEALRRDDASIVAAPDNFEIGALGDVVEEYDGIDVTAFRVGNVERENGAAEMLVEIDGGGRTIGTGLEVRLPRWWSVQLQQDGAAWRIVSVSTLERRLAGKLAAAPPEQLAAALARPDVDPERFLSQLARSAQQADACATLLWVLGTSQRHGFRKSEEYALRTLSYASVLSRHAADAVQIAEQSVALAERAQDPYAIAAAQFTLGYALWFSNRVDAAVAAFAAAADWVEQLEDPRVAMRALHMAGYLEMRRNRLHAAAGYAERQEALAARYRLPRFRMVAATLLGSAHARLGNLEIARRQDEIALEAARQMNDKKLETMALFNLAGVALDRGEYEKGRELLHQTLAMATRHLAPAELLVVLQTYAHQQLMQYDVDGLEETLARLVAAAAKLDERNAHAASLVLRAELRLLQGRPEEALTDAREAPRVHERGEGSARTQSVSVMAPALTSEGRALRALGRADAAEAVLRAALDMADAELAARGVDEAGSGALLETRLRPYHELLDLLAEQQCADDALVVAERVRARTLREVLRHGRVDVSAGLDDATRARELELERRVAAANRELLKAGNPGDAARLTRERDDARLELRRFRSQLSLQARTARSLAVDPQWEPRVAPDELVLEMVVAHTASYLIVLRQESGTPHADVHRITVGRYELEKRVNAFASAVENRDLSYRAEARALYDLLLGPAAAELATASRLRIVPDGVLWRVPFHVPVDPSGRHLVERYSLSYAPALAVPPRTTPTAASRGVLALGDPALGTRTATAARSRFRDPSLGALPDAAAEARAVARLYGDSEVRVGATATEAAFKAEAGPFRVLHLAAHSIVDDGAPMFSSIVLAASGNDPLEDGLLEAREIADLRLQAELAVLSGCETARGRITPGEGMVGLSWAFLAAGVPTTVVSQWKVGSESTAPLMVAFHRRLRTGATPADALRGAMLELRKREPWRHPFYWAPFVVVEAAR